MTPAPLKNIVLERKPTPAEHLPPVRPRFAPLPLPTPENPGLPVIDAGPDTIVGETHADGLPLVPTDTRPRPHSVTRVTGGPAAGFPNVDDFYPSVSVRANEQGGAAVQVCVDTRGRLTGEPSIVHSSGYANLDGAALKLAKAGSGHYRPSTEDGAAVASCFAYIARFRLKN